MRKLSDIETGLNKINEGIGFDPVLNTLTDEPFDQGLKECLVDVLRQSKGSEVITEQKEVSVLHKTNREPLMTFERFLEHQHN